ncbi:MAG: NADP-specific glutamate dehydrogenase [Acholeplasmataceae bacterium]|jgi:glutamate dehydrogenase (NADP+)|nr:NADP-specific glutamate dehydrogenase [Acholeplasmataceae bacterium]
MNNYLTELYQNLKQRFPTEKEYLNVVWEFLESIDFLIADYPEIVSLNIVERLIYPDRVISFKVPWLDDNNQVKVNIGYRVQFNNLIGPYKGGIRFDSSVNESILKFLAFEQTLKNSLTGLPLGGAKGGADFNPRGKSDFEIMRFCQSYIAELYKYIGPDVDVPAGDLGVGKKEVGYMFGKYKKITGKHHDSFTSKDPSSGGSLLRFEATGYGLVYITEETLETYFNTSLKNKKLIVSGTGNVGYNAAFKAQELGANLIAVSNIHGVIYDEKGIDVELIGKLEQNKEHLKNYLKAYPKAQYHSNPKSLWEIKADVAMPCATQNEVELADAKKLHKNNFMLVSEGANKPLTGEALKFLLANKILVLPSNAANAGGVATSSFEMTQNATFEIWSKEEVDKRLKATMNRIFTLIHQEALALGEKLNLTKAANVVSFKKLLKAMKHQGI